VRRSFRRDELRERAAAERALRDEALFGASSSAAPRSATLRVIRDTYRHPHVTIVTRVAAEVTKGNPCLGPRTVGVAGSIRVGSRARNRDSPDAGAPAALLASTASRRSTAEEARKMSIEKRSAYAWLDRRHLRRNSPHYYQTKFPG
jgi:hypothetical protein